MSRASRHLTTPLTMRSLSSSSLSCNVFFLLLGLVLGTYRKPNILLLITDDQDTLIGGTEHMPLLKEFVADQGMTFANAFVHTPICCPSRSSILSGRYLHNGGAVNNSLVGNCYGKRWREEIEHKTIGALAQKAGYKTGYVGKYLNQYGRCEPGSPPSCRTRVPPGWDMWKGLVGNSRYYNYSTVESNDGGLTVSLDNHGGEYRKDYLPDLVLNRTLEMLHEFADKGPFMLVSGWPTPHGPFTPAPQDVGYFADTQAHRTPNWNATSNQDKHWIMRRLAAIDEATEKRIDFIYRSRQESLRSVDRHVRTIIETLEDLGQLDNTYVLYTSDNGFQLGQHRLPSDKRHLYEQDIRVPLMVRGPGVPKNVVAKEAVLNIDFAPTIGDIVGSGDVSDVNEMDGRSFVPLLSRHNLTNTAWRSDFLVSYHGEGSPPCGMLECPPAAATGDSWNNTFHCVRTVAPQNSMYCQFIDDENFVEYYDLESDPWQLVNAADTMSDKARTALRQRLSELRSCHGPSCRKEYQTPVGLNTE